MINKLIRKFISVSFALDNTNVDVRSRLLRRLRNKPRLSHHNWISQAVSYITLAHCLHYWRKLFGQQVYYADRYEEDSIRVL